MHQIKRLLEGRDFSVDAEGSYMREIKYDGIVIFVSNSVCATRKQNG
jgi:hypothetical protein